MKKVIVFGSMLAVGSMTLEAPAQPSDGGVDGAPSTQVESSSTEPSTVEESSTAVEDGSTAIVTTSQEPTFATDESDLTTSSGAVSLSETTSPTVDAEVRDGGVDAGEGRQGDGGSLDASGGAVDTGPSDARDAGDAGDGGVDTSPAETSEPPKPAITREYKVIENEGRACSVAVVGQNGPTQVLGLTWITGLALAVGLGRRRLRTTS